MGAGWEVCKKGKWEQDGKHVRKGSGSRMGSMQGREVGAGWEVCKEGKWEQDGKYARKGSGSRIGSM